MKAIRARHPLLNCEKVLPVLKKDFSSLWHCRPRGNTLEIVTPFSTVTQKFVSVFITIRNNEYVVSDGGWLAQELDLYEVPDIPDLDYDTQLNYFSQAFGVRTFVDNRGGTFFYKKCSKPELLSGAVYDMSNFVCTLVGSLSVPKQDKVEKTHTERFQTEANGFLLGNSLRFTNAQVKPRYRLPDVQTIVFGAAIEYSNKVSLVTYVTGSREAYFSSSLKGSIVAFELASKSRYGRNGMIQKKVALLNNQAEGYSADRNSELMPLLKEHGAEAVTWTERGQLVEML